MDESAYSYSIIVCAPCHGLRFDNASSAQGVAVEGLGVALGRATLISGDLAAGRLVCPFEMTIHSEFVCWMVYPENRIKRAKVAMLRNWLVEEARLYRIEEGLPTTR